MKTLLFLFVIFLSLNSHAQNIGNFNTKPKKKSSSYMNTYDSSQSWGKRREDSLKQQNIISLTVMQNKLERFKKEAEESKYSEDKKQAIIKDLDFAMTRLIEADWNQDGYLNSEEQQIYKDNINKRD